MMQTLFRNDAQKLRPFSASVSQHFARWIEIKTLLVTLFAMSLLILVAENLRLRLSRAPPCSTVTTLTHLEMAESSSEVGPSLTAKSARDSADESRYFLDQKGVPRRQEDPAEEVDDRDERREFRPYGSAAALFVVFGAYRGGGNTFAIVGLGAKPLYSFGNPEFECVWVPSSSSSMASPVKSEIAYRMLPDVNYGRVYTVVVVNCTFQEAVGTDRKGGELVLYASHGDGLGKSPERIVALTEQEEDYNASAYGPPYPYEFLYCGSPLFGPLSPDRIREWITYHVKLFGPRSHFIFHDAGGMNAGVRAVLEPWRKLGYITVQDIKRQAAFDGYYYNQFLILNDCLHRTRFLANWTFFFDVDEYLYVAPGEIFRSIMSWYSNDTMVQFNQYRMSNVLCQENETLDDSSNRRWAHEKLVYRDMELDDHVKTSPKYAVQARNVFATGVHNSQKSLNHMQGEVRWAWFEKMRYYHYHGTITKDDSQLCSHLTNASSLTFEGTPFQLDTSMMTSLTS